MSIAVVDASALGAVVFKEAEGAHVLARLRSRVLVAPRLMAYELANVAVLKAKAHPESARLDHEGVDPRLVGRFRAHLERRRVREVADLAVRTGLTAYDASYLWLAEHMGAELVTLDKALLRTVTARPRRP